MYNMILVPLDGSKRAETILPYVEEMALTRKSTVVLLQVVEPSATLVTPYDMVPYYDPDLSEQMVEDAKTYLTGVQESFREKGINSKVLVEQGPIVKVILEVANQEKADLIAMASHGRTGLARVFYGSVAAGLLHQADRPLLLVRAMEA